MNELNRELTKKALECCANEECDACIHHGVAGCIGCLLKDALTLIEELTADVVEVVRCKDCAYYREENGYCLNPHCSSSFYGHRVKENHYCSFGERSENET